MIVGCLLDCKKEEQEKLMQALLPTDQLFFFENSDELEKSLVFDEIEVLIGEPSVVLVKKMKSLKWLQISWAGVDRYTNSPDFPSDILLTNASGAFGRIISEYILAGILALYRNLFFYREQMKQGGWQLIDGEQTLEGKNALILGAGDIGCETARKLKAFDAKVYGIRRVIREKPEFFDAMYTMSQLDEILPEMDLVILTLPGTKETKGLFTKKRLLQMKKEAFLVNVGRGMLIETKDLVEVLEQGHLSGVLLDVVNPEPLLANHPLRKFKRVMLTPHISGLSWNGFVTTRNKILAICCDNLLRYRSGEKLTNLVDLELGYRKIQVENEKDK